MSLKKYMIIDLSMLCVIGLLLEGIGTFFVNYMYVGAYPMTVISLLITFLAVARWGYKGLVVTLFCALGNLIGGQFILLRDVTYNWQIFLSVLVGLCSMSINLIPFSKMGTNPTLKNNWWFFGLMFGNFILFELVRGLVYAFILRGTEVLILNNAVGFDVTALVILLVMGFILRKQGVLLNFKDKLKSEKEQAELDRKTETEFTIEEIVQDTHETQDDVSES